MTVEQLREVLSGTVDDDEVHVLQTDGSIVALDEVDLDPAPELGGVLLRTGHSRD